MSHLSERGRALVDAARAADPASADRARVRAALAARLGAGVLSPEPPRAPAPPATTTLPIGAKAVLVGALVSALTFGAGIFVGRRSAPAMPSARSGLELQALRRARLAERAESVAPIASSIEVRAEPPAATEERRSPPRREATAKRAERAAEVPAVIDAPLQREEPAEIAAPPPPRSSLLEETEALRKAEIALRKGDGAAALAQIDALGQRQPDGVLREERLAARVLALCAAGRQEEAKQEAARFLAAMPASIQAPRVRGSCAFRGTGGQ